MTKKIGIILLLVVLFVNLFSVNFKANGETEIAALVYSKIEHKFYKLGDTINLEIFINAGEVPLKSVTLFFKCPMSFLSYEGFIEDPNYTKIAQPSSSVKISTEPEGVLLNSTATNCFVTHETEMLKLGTIQFKIKALDPNIDSFYIQFLCQSPSSIINSDGKRMIMASPASGIPEVNINATCKSVTINGEKSYKLDMSNALKLEVVKNPSDSRDLIYWSSLDESIAQVNEKGVVIPKGIGKTKIKATAESGASDEIDLEVYCSHHQMLNIKGVPSTCTKHGYTDYLVCKCCGKVMEGKEELPLAEHDYGEWIEEVPPKHANKESLPGVKGHYECKVCHKCFDKDHKEITDLTIPKEEHTCDHAEKTVKVSPTCTEKGTMIVKEYCKCGYLIRTYEEEIPALGHTGGKATCSQKAICERCGKEYGGYDSNYHPHTQLVGRIEPTFTEEGYTGDIVCNDCFKVIKEGHKIDKFVYKLLEGDNSKRQVKSGESLTFKANGILENLKTVSVDGVILTPDKEYTEINGSTIVTLKSEFLDTLAIGKHKLVLKYIDGGTVSANFEICETIPETPEKPIDKPTDKPDIKPNPPAPAPAPVQTPTQDDNKKNNSVTPKTGDASYLRVWTFGALLSGICLLGIVLRNRFKNKKNSK